MQCPLPWAGSKVMEAKPQCWGAAGLTAHMAEVRPASTRSLHGMPAPLASGAAVLSVLPAPFVLLPKVKARRSTAFAENDPWAVPMPTSETGPGPEAPASWVCACSQGMPCHQGC